MLLHLQACTGRTITGIRRVWFEIRGQYDQTVGPLEITFDSGDTVVLDAAANGQSLVVKLGTWEDPFEGKMTPENRQFVQASGKWSAVDVRHESPYVDLVGERLTCVTPISVEQDDVIGAIMTIGKHEVRAEVEADNLVVNVA
jgi:hypothetical protein